MSGPAQAPPSTFAPAEEGGAVLDGKETQELLQKWSLAETLKLHTFRFDEPFPAYDAGQFLDAFFRSEAVQSAVKVLSDVKGSWAPLGTGAAPTGIDYAEIPCTATSMEFFDRLYDCGVLRPTGQIVGCIPEYRDSFAINQELHKILLLEESEQYSVFSDAERNELLFRLFAHLAIGGPLNQYEDSIGPYFDLTKALYKDIISVARDATSKQVVVQSRVFQVRKVEGLTPLFPQEGMAFYQDFLYVVVNPGKRRATVLYNAWVGD